MRLPVLARITGESPRGCRSQHPTKIENIPDGGDLACRQQRRPGPCEAEGTEEGPVYPRGLRRGSWCFDHDRGLAMLQLDADAQLDPAFDFTDVGMVELLNGIRGICAKHYGNMLLANGHP